AWCSGPGVPAFMYFAIIAWSSALIFGASSARAAEAHSINAAARHFMGGPPWSETGKHNLDSPSSGRYHPRLFRKGGALASYDLAIIGSGPGGYVCAIRAGQNGLKTVVIEKDPRVGGTCTLRGCIPTKAVLHSADVYDEAQHGAAVGVKASGVELE